MGRFDRPLAALKERFGDNLETLSEWFVANLTSPSSSSIPSDSPSSSATAHSASSESPLLPCLRCRDEGWVRSQAEPGEPGFGVPIRCPDCKDERDRVRAARHYEQISAECGLEDGLRGIALVDLVRYAGNEQALDWAEAMADDPGDAWLLITGVPGNGKTRMLAAIANAQLARGTAVIYGYVPKLLDWLREGYGADGGEERYAERMVRFERAPLLLLDDLGAGREKPSDWEVLTIETVLNTRHDARLPTVITSNLSMDKLRRKFGERVYSRLKRYPATVVLNRAVPYHEYRPVAVKG